MKHIDDLLVIWPDAFESKYEWWAPEVENSSDTYFREMDGTFYLAKFEDGLLFFRWAQEKRKMQVTPTIREPVVLDLRNICTNVSEVGSEKSYWDDYLLRGQIDRGDFERLVVDRLQMRRVDNLVSIWPSAFEHPEDWWVPDKDNEDTFFVANGGHLYFGQYVDGTVFYKRCFRP
jgi:hypothetical protein